MKEVWNFGSQNVSFVIVGNILYYGSDLTPGLLTLVDIYTRAVLKQ